MKVLMLSGDPNILVSGTEAHERMRWYATAFDELHVVVMTSARTEPRKFDNLFLYSAFAGATAGKPVSARSLLGQRWALWRIARDVARRIGPAVVSAQSADEIGFIAWRIARRFRMPLQVQIHTDILSPWYRRASMKEWLRYRIARFLIPRAGCIRVVSERIKKSLVASGLAADQSRISVLSIMTDVVRFRDASRDPATDARFAQYDFKIIAVGRFFDKEKNFSLLIDAMAELVKIAPKAILVIVGDGPDRKNYELRIMNYGLEENIVIESWRNDLPSFYKSFDCYAMTSNYEGWGRTVIEAMAAGLPIVMTDVGLAGEVVKGGENGIVIPVGDKAALRNALASLYRDSTERKALADSARRTAADLSLGRDDYLARYADALVKCNEKIIKKCHPER